MAGSQHCISKWLRVGFNDNIQVFLGRTLLKLTGNQIAIGFIGPDFLYALVGITSVVAGAIGALASAWIAEHLGRRNGLLLNHAFAVLGSILCATCVHANQAALLFTGRFFLGLNCGITTGIAPMYLAEVAPRELRGTVAACNALGITLGDVVAYLATLSSTLNTNELWPIACGLCVVPAAISLLILPFCPESPRFLFMKNGDEIAARKAFCRLNSNENVEALVCELMEEMASVKTKPQFRFTHLFTRKDLRMPQAIKGYSFVPFLVVVLLCWVFIFMYMPETRNRKFDEVARGLARERMVIGRQALSDRLGSRRPGTNDASNKRLFVKGKWLPSELYCFTEATDP
ncbi:unnamed protein product [Dicrocoelium dendriticum]|nr:unnamed protein product [Dicrocoelium dendriticum]